MHWGIGNLQAGCTIGRKRLRKRSDISVALMPKIKMKQLSMVVVLYSQTFSLDKNFAKPSYFCIAEIFGGRNFCQCGNP